MAAFVRFTAYPVFIDGHDVNGDLDTSTEMTAVLNADKIVCAVPNDDATCDLHLLGDLSKIRVKGTIDQLFPLGVPIAPRE